MLFLAAALWGLCIPIMKALGTEQTLLFPDAGSFSSSLASLALRFGLVREEHLALLPSRRRPAPQEIHA
jgi:hypothetical protein